MSRIMAAEAKLSRTVSESDVYLFAGITGDLAPYHVNEHFMQSRSYGGRVVHGVLTLGFVSAVSTQFWESVNECGKGISAGYDAVRFLHPLYLGDTIYATYRVDSHDADAGRFFSKAEVRNQDDKLCLTATHIVKQVEMERS